MVPASGEDQVMQFDEILRIWSRITSRIA
jgi:hypothetical protein